MTPDRQVERLLGAPCQVIDPLPRRVPAEGEGRYFHVESHWLSGQGILSLLGRFASLLLKLNCYYDLTVCPPGEEDWVLNPPPEALEAWVRGGELRVLLTSQDALITLSRDDTHMTVYHPSGALLDLLRPLALSEGLFIWPGAEPDEQALPEGS